MCCKSPYLRFAAIPPHLASLLCGDSRDTLIANRLVVSAQFAQVLTTNPAQLFKINATNH